MELNDTIVSIGTTKTWNEALLLAYSRCIFSCVNSVQEEREGQKKRLRTGEIKVWVISHTWEKQSDPRLAWVIFYKIAEVYLDVTKLETTTAHEIVTNKNIPMAEKNECVADDDRVVGVLVEISESESNKTVVADGDGVEGVQLVMIKKGVTRVNKI